MFAEVLQQFPVSSFQFPAKAKLFFSLETGNWKPETTVRGLLMVHFGY
jgi:hypothetical protein